jgi:putative redox protein
VTTGDALLASVHLHSGDAPHRQDIRAGRHEIVVDEPATLGGGDQGPTPYNLLLSSLGACTSITLRMYADRKGWQLGPVRIDLTMRREHDEERIERTIVLDAALSPEQRTRLGEIAEKTPVTKTLRRAMQITTTIR